jgi:hypothetical protein
MGFDVHVVILIFFILHGTNPLQLKAFTDSPRLCRLDACFYVAAIAKLHLFIAAKSITDSPRLCRPAASFYVAKLHLLRSCNYKCQNARIIYMSCQSKMHELIT